MTPTTSNDDQATSAVPRRRDVYLTLINLGSVYFLINVSYSGLETLQSTVNVQHGLGTTSIGVLYAFLIASSLLVGPTVVDRLRAKRTLYVAWSANAVFAVANAFPRWETLVPASAFVGVTLASGNIVYGLYVTALADQLNSTNDVDNSTTSKRVDGVSGKRRQQNAVVHVNSVLLAFLNTGSVVGSLTGSLIIGSSQLPGYSDDVNSSNLTDISVCGVDHCPFIAEHIRAFASPDPSLVFVVGAVFLLCVVAATALTVVLRPLPSDRPCCRTDCHQVVRETTKVRNGMVLMRTRIAGTLRLLANTRLLLLIPTLIMMGVITSFAIGAFNQSFVACSLGIGMIGYAMIGYRLSFIGASLLTGQLVRCLHRRTIVAAAMLTNVAVVGSWFAWTPPPPSSSVNPGMQVAVLMIVWCVLNGAVIGVLRAVVYSLFPLLFAASFDQVLAQAAVWDSLGTSVTYFANSQLCFSVKAGVVMTLMIVAMVTYGTLEYVMARDSRRLRQHASTSRDARSTAATNLVGSVVLDSSLIKNSGADKTKTCVSLLVDHNQITVVSANANCQ